MTTLFDLTDFAPETPQWAADCFYCTPDTTGYYDLEHHQWAHLPVTCAICRQSSPNRLLFDQSHGVNLGASWESGYLLCSSLSLKLNHLRHDLRTGRPHDARAHHLRTSNRRRSATRRSQVVIRRSWS